MKDNYKAGHTLKTFLFMMRIVANKNVRIGMNAVRSALLQGTPPGTDRQKQALVTELPFLCS